MDEKIYEEFVKRPWDIESNDEEELELLKHAIRMIDETVNGKEFPGFEYDDPIEEIRNILKELNDEISIL